MKLINFYSDNSDSVERSMERFIGRLLTSIEYEQEDAYRTWRAVYLGEKNGIVSFCAYYIYCGSVNQVHSAEIIPPFNLSFYDNITFDVVKKAILMKVVKDITVDDNDFVSESSFREYLLEKRKTDIEKF